MGEGDKICAVCGKIRAARGNSDGEGGVKPAVLEAAEWAGALERAEHRGPGDTIEAARHRVATVTGVTASYLRRLRYRSHEMTDVAGSAYRALRLEYERRCAVQERSARHARALRLAIERGGHGQTTDEMDVAPMARGMAPALGDPSGPPGDAPPKVKAGL